MKKSVYLVCLLLLCLSACKVEEPQGPDGNANVKTQIITVTPANWTGTSFLFEAKKVCTLITPEIVNSGAVLVYRQIGNGSYMPVALSNTDFYPDEEGNPILFNSHLFYQYSTSAISFYRQDDDAQTEPLSENMVFKVVAISSGEVVSGINTRDYHAVAAALGI
jgi:hypothetical protein